MLWLTDPKGYARFKVDERVVNAHRVSYTLAYGPIPPGLVIDHVRDRGCLHKHCVAPLHLEAVTNAENIRRGDAGQHHKVKTHCANDHLYDDENTYVSPKGQRICRACRRKHARDFRKRARTA
jgi:hypothetical protein